jgi:hypothetical protein
MALRSSEGRATAADVAELAAGAAVHSMFFELEEAQQRPDDPGTGRGRR